MISVWRVGVSNTLKNAGYLTVRLILSLRALFFWSEIYRWNHDIIFNVNSF